MIIVKMIINHNFPQINLFYNRKEKNDCITLAFSNCCNIMKFLWQYICEVPYNSLFKSQTSNLNFYHSIILGKSTYIRTVLNKEYMILNYVKTIDLRVP